MGTWPHLDKVLHFLAFAIGGFLLSTAWVAGYATLPRRRFLLAFVLLLLFGLADEMRQLLVPGRSGGDWGDFTANALGTMAGVLFSWFIHAHFLSFFRNPPPVASHD